MTNKKRRCPKGHIVEMYYRRWWCSKCETEYRLSRAEKEVWNKAYKEGLEEGRSEVRKNIRLAIGL